MSQMSEQEVQAYLDQHKIQTVVEDAINAAVKNLAPEPCRFMAETLWPEAKRQKSGPSEPKVEVPVVEKHTVKLTYFDVDGLGEPIRFALTMAGVEFEDHRIAGADWQQLKPTLTYGQLPCLFVDGTQLYHFPNQQVERHFTDGLKEIKFADGTLKVILPNGEVQSLSDLP